MNSRPVKSFTSIAITALSLLLMLPVLVTAQQLDMSKLQAMEPRNIGPAGMSGRVTAIDAIVNNPDIVYVGTASGGLWKSKSGGTAWEPIFTDQEVASIGDVTIHQKNPDIIWVGTGEGNPRNSMTNGAGIYRTLDGGKTWELMGLEQTRNIHRVIVHPDNPDIVYVGALGNPWDENEHRGVYKTTDGGQSWEKILYNNDRTGVGDMVMDPSNPDKILVNMWEHHRDPWFFDSGGEGSGLYMTIDGGKSWKELTPEDGIPSDPLGRIGLAFAPSNPDIVYALIESSDNAFYRSEDGGYTWEKRTDENIGSRPFYYADIRVDPKNENRIYNLFSRVSMSIDGGKNFEQIIPYSGVHPDHHAWWINPENPNLIYEGNDGGIFISRDRAETWEFVDNIPVGQFYHITVDMQIPYNVYGGMQDNGTWQGPSEVWRRGGIRNTYWEEVLFGDGFDVAIDHSNDRYIYAMSQRGNVRRVDTKTGHTRNVRPVHPENEDLRFNWNAAIANSPHDVETIYFGTQFVHKSTDRGETWEIISPDLTTDDPEKQRQYASGGLTTDATGAENFTTITTIAESPLQEGVIWAGTDDGNVQVTRDGGETWNNVVDRMPGVPEGSWVHQVHASGHNAGEAFVVINDYRRGNWKPMVYHTTDYGRNWENLVGEEQVWGYSLSFAQDPVEPNLMFTGTEFGLYVSIDGGDTWTKWTNGYPTVSTYDMQIHPRDYDLAISTFGRSMFILDDIRPLRELAAKGISELEQPVNVYPAPDAYLAEWRQAAGTRFSADGMFEGENSRPGAMLTYSVNKSALEKKPMSEEPAEADSSEDKKNKEKKTRVKIRVKDNSGKVIRTFYDEAEHDGFNRAYWNLREDGVRFPGSRDRRPNQGPPSGDEVLPGTYTVLFAVGDHTDSTRVTVNFDPRIEVSMADLRARKQMLDDLENFVSKATDAVDRIRESKETVDLVMKQLKADTDTNMTERVKELQKLSKAMKDSLTRIEHLFLPDRDRKQGEPRDTSMNVRSELFEPNSYISSSFDAPGERERMLMDQARTVLGDALAEFNAFYRDHWADYRRQVEGTDLDPFKEYEPIEIE